MRNRTNEKDLVNIVSIMFSRILIVTLLIMLLIVTIGIGNSNSNCTYSMKQPVNNSYENRIDR